MASNNALHMFSTCKDGIRVNVVRGALSAEISEAAFRVIPDWNFSRIRAIARARSAARFREIMDVSKVSIPFSDPWEVLPSASQ